MKTIKLRFKKVGKKLEFEQPVHKLKWQMFLKTIQEDEVVEMYVDRVSGDGSLSQLAKLHATLREIAKFTGNTVTYEKTRIKRKAGLCYEVVVENERCLECKSFSDSTREELDYVINLLEIECVDLGIGL
jgi:hypothetical protein